MPISRFLSVSSFNFEKRYSEKHEWAELLENNSKVARVGITKYAADSLGDIVYASLPETGQSVEANGECGALESVKAASEIYSPLSGTITEKNENVEDNPALINKSPEEDGWLFKLDLLNPGDFEKLMSKQKYEKFLESQTDDLE